MLHWLKFTLVLLLVGTPAMAAEDEGLYAPPPPAGATWIRYIGEGSLSLKDVSLTEREYRQVMQGRYTVSQHSAVANIALEAGKYYTLSSLGGRSLNLLTDPTLENRARAMLVLYNFTDKPALDLITADGELKVIEGVTVQANGSRMVQPINVKLAVAINGQVITELNELQLQRGETYSIIAAGTGDAITAELMQNTTEQPD